jgi:geranylgeranyl transferase type-2 subunit beta
MYNVAPRPVLAPPGQTWDCDGPLRRLTKMSVYLETLTQRLTAALAALPAEVRERHARYLRRSQNPDGGFSGREGDSDLYYTGFALRGLALAGALDDAIARPAAGYLRGRLQGQAQIIDFLSLLYGALLLQTSTGVDVFEGADPLWPEAVASALERLRRDDGGYAKTAEGGGSSTYHTFLVVLCQQLIGRAPSDPDALRQFVLSRRREDGGFVEIAAMRKSGTNPTAAAIGLLSILGPVEGELRSDVVDFLAEMQDSDGGLRANTRIPLADLLSTFTGLTTLADLGALDAIDLAAAGRFVRSLEAETGGFHMASLDPAVDVEYTFYGLGAWGQLLAK